MTHIKNQTLFIRADASAEIGIGHVMRTWVLAETWMKMGGKARYLCATIPEALEVQLREGGAEISKLHGPDLEETIMASQGGWLVVDAAHYTPEMLTALQTAGRHVLLFDDLQKLENYPAQIVLNQNVYAEDFPYTAIISPTVLLKGARFALIRENLRSHLPWQRTIPDIAQNILVMMGGADPQGTTSILLQSLDLIESTVFTVNVVVGPANARFEQIAAQAATSRHNVTVRQNEKDMARLFKAADIAITSAGSVIYELACFSTPIVTCSHEMEQLLAATISQMGAAIYLGPVEHLEPLNIAQKISKLIHEPKTRTSLSQHAGKLVDGKGAQRVINAIINYKY